MTHYDLQKPNHPIYFFDCVSDLLQRLSLSGSHLTAHFSLALFYRLINPSRCIESNLIYELMSCVNEMDRAARMFARKTRRRKHINKHKDVCTWCVWAPAHAYAHGHTLYPDTSIQYLCHLWGRSGLGSTALGARCLIICLKG